tara:strand:- start:16440 stop:16619 length:180 start_codon:yes stop_codon:yes gene_type:complete
MKTILKLIELFLQLFRRYENSEHDKRKKAAKRDPVEYFNTLNGVRDKSKNPTDSTDIKH